MECGGFAERTGNASSYGRADVVGSMIQRMRHPDVATYVGKGRAQEFCDTEKQLGLDLVIFDDDFPLRNSATWKRCSMRE